MVVGVGVMVVAGFDCGACGTVTGTRFVTVAVAVAVAVFVDTIAGGDGSGDDLICPVSIIPKKRPVPIDNGLVNRVNLVTHCQSMGLGLGLGLDLCCFLSSNGDWDWDLGRICVCMALSASLFYDSTCVVRIGTEKYPWWTTVVLLIDTPEFMHIRMCSWTKPN